MSASQEVASAPPSNATLNPESIARYLQGVPPQMEQYAFFIGDWDCELRAHAPGGGPPRVLRAEWRARWVHQGRMLVDDLGVFLPDGKEVLGWMNLRTWCHEAGCWQISGHRVLAPCSGAITSGYWRDGEMQLEFDTGSEGARVENRVRFHAITDRSFEWEWRSRPAGHEPFALFAALSARRMDSSKASADGIGTVGS
jgi:hypothetical protein